MVNKTPVDYLDDLSVFLSEQGYASETIRQNTTYAKHFLKWIIDSNFEITDFDENTIDNYTESLRNKRKSAKSVSIAIQ